MEPYSTYACAQRANLYGYSYFAMENPHLYRRQGEAECVHLNDLPSQTIVGESECGREWYKGDRLGNAFRLAVHEMKGIDDGLVQLPTDVEYQGPLVRVNGLNIYAGEIGRALCTASGAVQVNLTLAGQQVFVRWHKIGQVSYVHTSDLRPWQAPTRTPTSAPTLAPTPPTSLPTSAPTSAPTSVPTPPPTSAAPIPA